MFVEQLLKDRFQKIIKHPMIRKILSLSAKHGDVGITSPTLKATERFDDSKESSLLTELNAEEHKSHVHSTRQKFVQKLKHIKVSYTLNCQSG